MADSSQPDPPSDDESDVAKFAALLDAPVTALGLPERAAQALAQGLGVTTVRTWQRTSNVRRAQAILTLADGKNPQ